jgi:tetratricopeptide (TPR) repeat protein
MRSRTLNYFIILLLAAAWWGVPVMAQKSKKQNQQDGVRQKDQSQAEYYFVEGMKYYVLENYTKALDYFYKSLASNADNAGANYAVAEAMFKSKNFTQAIPYAEKALKLNDNNKYYYLLLAHLYEKDRKYAQAVKTYQELFKKSPDDPEPYFDLAAVYLYQEKYEDAIRSYDRIEKLIGVNEEVSRQKQQIYLKINKTDMAIAEGKKLIDAFPGEIKYVILLAEIYNLNKRTDEAIPLLEKAVSSGSGNAHARLILSDIYRNKGQTQKADKELELAFSNSDLEADTKVQILAGYIRSLKDDESKKNALKLANMIIKAHPQDAKAYAVYGDLLVMSEQKENARNNYIKASRLDNSIFEVWNRIIQLDAELEQMDSLAKHSEQALELFPNQSIFWFYNGTAHLIKKNYQKAVDALEDGKKLAQQDQALLNEYNSRLGDAYNGLGDHVKSDAAYQAVLDQDPDNASVLNNYSYFLSLRKEKLELAKQMSGRLVEKNPDNPTYLDTHAWVLYMMKDYQQARKYLEKAAKDGLNGTILEHYGDVLYKLGETEKAVQQWQKAKQVGDTSNLIDKKIAQKKLYE